jgi:hypothetical protein
MFGYGALSFNVREEPSSAETKKMRQKHTAFAY